jgi:Deoxyhypusine synthase
MTQPTPARLAEWEAQLSDTSRDHLNKAADQIVAAKQRGGAVVAVTGSGPNIHEGVTTLIAELIRKGIIDGVLTSSAVVAHEMAGTLDRVKRIRAADHPGLSLPTALLPRGDVFEITELTAAGRAAIQDEIEEGWDLYERIAAMPGDVIIKAAGNMAWPIGPRTERLAREVEAIAREGGLPFERVAGIGADPYTMIGAGARRGVPVLVSIPQLVGGGAVGLAIGDAISITRRARLVAETLASASVIVESAIALSQEIHDGPYETYTGHGIWSAWEGGFSYSLQGKTLVRIDLDPNLEKAWLQERHSAQVQEAVNRGLPKTKVTGIPFRMEMSGFARLESSLPVTADIGITWPILAAKVAGKLGVTLDFLSAPQETPEGKEMRAWISENVQPLDRDRMREAIRGLRATTGDA